MLPSGAMLPSKLQLIIASKNETHYDAPLASLLRCFVALKAP